MAAEHATVTISMMASRRWLSVLLAAAMSSGCTQTGSSAVPTTSIPPAEVLGAVESIPFTAAPEPTGVPGLNAADPFCSAWAAYSATLQALGVAASFGDVQGGDFAALELAAAPRLVELVAEIDAAWPPELAAEHEAVVDRRLGPYARRAQRGVDALRAGGVTDVELAALSSVWQTALTSRDPASPVIDLPAVADALRTKLDAAGIAYDAAVTPFSHDPSLVVDGVNAPATGSYLAAHCPDLAASGVGDAL